MLRRLAGWVLVTALLGSCGIRLPIQTDAPKSLQRVEVVSEPKPAVAVRDPDVLVWLIADEYHTGMVFPYDWLEESGFIAPAGFGRPRYVALSWGNRNAYSKEGLNSFWKFARVLLTPTPSVMELIPVKWNVAEVCPHQRIWRKLVPRERGSALANFLNECSATGPDGRPKVVCESSWGKGVQLESPHWYFIPRVCNVWTVQAIECLGGEINPWLALTANGLIRQAENPPNNFEQIWLGGGSEP